MKIGIFDSGLGGLLILKSIVRKLPQYDYIYLGDTKRVPYGNRSAETIYEFLRQSVDFLFQKGCMLVIVACNTASAEALRKIQKVYLPKKYPSRRVLGVIRPTVEAAVEMDVNKIGVLATQGTVNSEAYVKELRKLKSNTEVLQQAAPMLVPLVEYGSVNFARPFLKEYLNPLLERKIGALILGCTHYPILKFQIRNIVGRKIKVISQDEVVPGKLREYLGKHPEIEKKLSKKSEREFLVTDVTAQMKSLSKKWFGRRVNLKVIKY